MAKPSPKVVEAWTIQHENLVFGILMEIVRNDEQAAEYAEFHADAKRLTNQQLHTVARYASERYVHGANRAPGKLKEEEIPPLLKESIREALKRLAEENIP